MDYSRRRRPEVPVPFTRETGTSILNSLLAANRATKELRLEVARVFHRLDGVVITLQDALARYFGDAGKGVGTRKPAERARKSK
jgi:hypothetical protein